MLCRQKQTKNHTHTICPSNCNSVIAVSINSWHLSPARSMKSKLSVSCFLLNFIGILSKGNNRPIEKKNKCDEKKAVCGPNVNDHRGWFRSCQ